MNWKSITAHATLLLLTSVAAGFFEPQPDLADRYAVLAAYLATQAALFIAWLAIVAHLACKVPSRPFVHALLAALLSESIAFVLTKVLASLVPFELPETLLPLAVFEHVVLLAAVAAGTLFGTSIRRRRRLDRAAVDAPYANGG